MCTAKPKLPKTPAAPPAVTPETVDEAAQTASIRERRRAASAFGRSSTMIGGSMGAPTGQGKTLLGG